MEDEHRDIFRKLFARNTDVLLALALLAVLTYVLVGRYLLADGTILFGDFVPTLDLKQFLRTNYPLWSNTNCFSFVGAMRLPYFFVFCYPFYAVNAPADVFFKFVITCIFVISGMSMYVTARHLLNRQHEDRKTVFACSMISSILYAFNPWVIDRIYHHFLLVTYSVSPLVLLISLQIFSKDRVDLKRILILALLCCFASTSPHSVFFLLFMISSLFLFLLLSNRATFFPRIKSFAVFVSLYALVNAFWILPLVNYESFAGVLYPDYVLHIDNLRLLSRNSDMFNVFRLVAYWWPQVSYSFKVFPYDALWTLASAIIPAICFSALIYYRRNRMVIYVSILGIIATLLATGTRAPLSHFYEWLCFDSPLVSSFGWLFRDPNKWAIFLPLTYSVLLAFTCLRIIKLPNATQKTLFRKIVSVILGSLLLSLIFIYVIPSTINSFEGPYKPVNIPTEIRDANDWLANSSDASNVLWLPSYAEFGASWVYNNLSSPFDIDSSPKPTFDPSSKYTRGYLNYFNEIIQKSKCDSVSGYLDPLNIQYVVFHNDSASEKYASDLLQGLQRQKDLELASHEGTVSIFRRRTWHQNILYPYSKTVAVVGGFGSLVSLNALGMNSSIVFTDQNVAYEDVGFDMLALSGDLVNDALPFFLNESLVLAPSDFADRHSPVECWSKASLSDLTGGPFHVYLGEFGVDCWDFDYDRGVILSWAPKAKLSIPFDVDSNERQEIFLRTFENAAGGNITVYLDDSTIGTINTYSQANRFAWKTAGVCSLASGSHILTLEDTNGLNAVNLIAIMPEGKASEVIPRFETFATSKDLLYIIEGESGALNKDNATRTEHLDGASNGEVLELDSDSKASWEYRARLFW